MALQGPQHGLRELNIPYFDVPSQVTANQKVVVNEEGHDGSAREEVPTIVSIDRISEKDNSDRLGRASEK